MTTLRRRTLALAALLALLVPGVAAQDQRDASEDGLPPWTFLIYGAADNDADGHMLRFVDDVRAALSDHEGVELILFMDRAEGYSDDATVLGEDFTDARLYRLTGGGSERLSGGTHLPQVRLEGEWEADSGDAHTLASFLRFGKQAYPARHTGLLIYSHADGIGMCPDEDSDSEMDLSGLPARMGEGCSVDWTGLELCNMAGFEIAYSWRPGNGGFATDTLVAIPNAGPALDWARILATFDPAMTPQQLGALAVTEGGAARDDHARDGALDWEAVAAYDLTHAGDAKAAWDRFAVALAEMPGSRRVLESLRGPGPRGTVMNYSHDEFDSGYAYVDAVDLARRAEGAADLSESVRDAARTARQALDAVVLASYGMDGYADFVPGENGIFISFPDGQSKVFTGFLKRERVWTLYDWYGASAFAQDGADASDGEITNWYELLDAWFGAEETDA
jgi:clostripain